jgi:hypothetical protein
MTRRAAVPWVRTLQRESKSQIEWICDFLFEPWTSGLVAWRPPFLSMGPTRRTALPTGLVPGPHSSRSCTAELLGWSFRLAQWCFQWCWAAGHISAGMGRFADVAVCL